MAKDLTPKEFKCNYSAACPAVLELEPEDLTPPHLRCGDSLTCPSVTAVAGDLLIVGKRGDQRAASLGKGVGDDEYAIVINPDLLNDYIEAVIRSRANG